MQFGIIGSGSWATALAKILTDKKHVINWWIRDADTLKSLSETGYNPRYLRNAKFDTSLLRLSNKLKEVVAKSEVLVVAVPSAFAEETLSTLGKQDFAGKKIISAIKGLLPEKNILLNYYLQE